MPTINITTKAKDPKSKHPLESILYGIDFSPLLVAGETLTGAPTITGGADLTITGAAVNTATFLNDAGKTVAIGAGIQVRVSGGTDQLDYPLVVSCLTSLGNTRAVVCPLEIRAS
jgi:hypothetical protein